jgi:hypothetical protein
VTLRIVDCPTRKPGESGRAFVERMLAQLSNTGGATALPTPPKVEITAKAARVAKDLRVPVEPEPAAVAEAKPGTSTHYLNNREVWALAAEAKRAHKPMVTDWLGRLDRRPTTKAWPPGPMGPDGRSTHRYVGPWPPKWASATVGEGHRAQKA